MDTDKKYGILSSSIDPQKLSTTVLSAARVLAGLLVFSGFLTAADSTTLLTHINGLTQTVMILVPLGYSMWNSGEVIFGIFQKALVAWHKPKTGPVVTTATAEL